LSREDWERNPGKNVREMSFLKYPPGKNWGKKPKLKKNGKRKSSKEPVQKGKNLNHPATFRGKKMGNYAERVKKGKGTYP